MGNRSAPLEFWGAWLIVNFYNNLFYDLDGCLLVLRGNKFRTSVLVREPMPLSSNEEGTNIWAQGHIGSNIRRIKVDFCRVPPSACGPREPLEWVLKIGYINHWRYQLYPRPYCAHGPCYKKITCDRHEAPKMGLDQTLEIIDKTKFKWAGTSHRG